MLKSGGRNCGKSRKASTRSATEATRRDRKNKMIFRTSQNVSNRRQKDNPR